MKEWARPWRSSRDCSLQTDAPAVNFGRDSCGSPGASAGYAKHAFVLICAAHSYMSPSPHSIQHKCWTMHIHVCSKRSGYLFILMFSSLCVLLLPSLLRLHCHCNGIKSFTLRDMGPVLNRKEITFSYLTSLEVARVVWLLYWTGIWCRRVHSFFF